MEDPSNVAKYKQIREDLNADLKNGISDVGTIGKNGLGAKRWSQHHFLFHASTKEPSLKSPKTYQRYQGHLKQERSGRAFEELYLKALL